MEIETILATLLPSLLTIVGVYVKMNGEVVNLKARVKAMENDRKELKTLINTCIEGISELKILIARKGI
tara:strand:+ start:426 stop:632 length:207 start_codon:yes stop_codon:yes gene_type:complete